jgi:hypothetical protein
MEHESDRRSPRCWVAPFLVNFLSSLYQMRVRLHVPVNLDTLYEMKVCTN